MKRLKLEFRDNIEHCIMIEFYTSTNVSENKMHTNQTYMMHKDANRDQISQTQPHLGFQRSMAAKTPAEWARWSSDAQ